MKYIDSTDLNGHSFHDLALFNPSNLVFEKQELDEACHHVGQIFKPHALKVSAQDKQFKASMHHISTGALSLSRLEYGADVLIEPDHLEKFYLIQIPTQGHAEIEFGAEKFISYSQVASLLSPDQSLRMRWTANSPQLIIKISREDFTHHCQQHVVKSNGKSLQFNPKLDFNSQGGAYFLQLVRSMIEALASPQHPLHHPLAFKQFESSLFNALLYGQPNDAFCLGDKFYEKNVAPFYIKRAEEFIREYLHEALNIEMIAEKAGVSTRTLFTGFKNHFGMTPMAYLRELRFEQAHLELMQNEQLSVTDVAYKWGFTHLGRFSQEYKRRYGELPSNTRRQILRSILH